MIYIDTESSSVAYNLALEYYFTAEKDIGEDVILLLWCTEPTLIIGKFQNALEEINLPYAREKGLKVVRRLSGGGTIYTDPGNFMYTFITRGNADEISFKEYTTPVITALREMGVDASFNGRNDLIIDGRKFSGTAQYKLAGNTVHHGTLMFDASVEEMVRSTTVDPLKILSKSIKSVRDRVTNVSEHLPEPMDPEVFRSRLVKSLLRGEERVYVLTDEDRARIQQISDEKFDNWEAVYGANPKFSIENSERLAGGRMTFSLEVRKGRIERCAVSGDFFANVDGAAFEEALKGCPYSFGDVLAALNRAGLGNAVYRVGPEEMAALITRNAMPPQNG